MESRILVGGHARVGSWVAISVHLTNDGPPVTGELRLAGGTQGQTRFGTAVDLPTQADKTYVIYAQPPTFGSELKVDLIDGDYDDRDEQGAVHDPRREPAGGRGRRRAPRTTRRRASTCPPNMNQVAPLILNLTPDDLPERVEAWTSIDRIVWQDTEADRLSPAQLEAMRGWLAGGGRLVIAGGTIGPAALAAFPDAMLPFRPVVTTDVPADEPDRTARPAACGRDHRPGPVRRAHRGSDARHGRRSCRRGRAAVRLGLGHAPRLRPERRLDREDRRMRRTSGDGCCPAERSVACRSATTTC